MSARMRGERAHPPARALLYATPETSLYAGAFAELEAEEALWRCLPLFAAHVIMTAR